MLDAELESFYSNYFHLYIQLKEAQEKAHKKKLFLKIPKTVWNEMCQSEQIFTLETICFALLQVGSLFSFFYEEIGDVTQVLI